MKPPAALPERRSGNFARLWTAGTVSNFGEAYVASAELGQAQLKEAGISARLKLVPGTEYNQVVVSPCTAAQPGLRSGAVQLTAGWHHVRLDLSSAQGGLQWVWLRPDGVQETVPPDALRLAGVSPDGAIAWPDPPGPLTCAP